MSESVNRTVLYMNGSTSHVKYVTVVVLRGELNSSVELI